MLAMPASDVRGAGMVVALWVLGLACGPACAVETHNLEVVWMRAGPPGVFWTYGEYLCGGDFNGDGYCDFAFSADSWIDPYRGIIESHTYVFMGQEHFDSVPDYVIVHDTLEGALSSLASADVNGDGFSDLVAGDWTGRPEERGSVRIYLGGSPFDTTCDYRIIGPTRASAFGCAASSAGDVDGDGWEDLVVGAPDGSVRPGFPAGWVQVFYGGPGFDTCADVNILGGHEGQDEYFGFDVSGGADLNMDGYDDIIIGALNYGYRGRVYIYFGGTPLDTGHYVAFTGESGGADLGKCVDLLRNRGHYGHAIAGAPFYPVWKGTGYVFYGGSPMDSVPDVRISGHGDSCEIGYSAARAGDLTGDGNDEFLFGDVGENSCRGAAYIFKGGPSGLDTTPMGWIKGSDPYDCVGSNVAPIGDADRDGNNEFAVSDYFMRLRVWVCRYAETAVAEDAGATPEQATRLLVQQPNPVHGWVVVRYSLASAGHVSVQVCDPAGRVLTTLANGQQRAGTHTVRWRSQDAAGVYFCRLTADGCCATEKLVLQR